eukprot:s1961_g9.t1
MATLLSWNAAIGACRRQARWEAALVLLQSMAVARLPPDLVSFTAAAGACEAARHWQHAVALLGGRAQLDSTACTTLVTAWGRSGRWQHALAVLGPGGAGRRWRLGLAVLGAAVTAAARGRRWREALALLEEARTAGCEQDEVGYGAAMHGCVLARRWQPALSLLSAMRLRRIASEMAVNIGIAACEEGHQWQLAINLLANLCVARVRRTDTVNTAASSCERGRKWQQALHLFADAFHAGVTPSLLSIVVMLSACATGSSWEPALSWLSRAQNTQDDLTTQTACLNAAIASCSRAAQWERALTVLRRSVIKDVISYSSAMDACCWGQAWRAAAVLLATAATDSVELGAAAYRSAVEGLEHVQKKEAVQLRRRVLVRARRAMQDPYDPDVWSWWELSESLGLGPADASLRMFRSVLFENLMSATKDLVSQPASLPCAVVRRSVEELKQNGSLASPKGCSVLELRNLLSALSEVGRPTEVVSTPVVATSPPSSELTQAFAKGTAVEAPFRGGPLWFQGWVVNHKQNGIAVVRYNDGQEEDVPFTSLRGAPGTSFVAPTPTPVTERGPPSSPPSLPATLIADAGNGLPRTLDPEPRAQVPALPAWQLKSVYAEGVALSALPEVHRAVAAEGSELVMGRMVQAGGFWDALVPEKDLQTRVSRKHFKLSCRMLSLGDGRRQPAFFVSCLSQNGLLVNGRYMGPDVEQRIEHGAQLGLGVETLATSKSQPASMMSVATAAAWRPPAVKPFVVFELEVLDQAQRADPKTIVPVAQQAVVIDRATPLVFPRASGQGLPSAGGLPTGTAASLYPFSQSDSMTAPPECFALQKDSQLCQSPLVKFFKSQMGS